MPSWVELLRNNLRDYKANLENRGLLSDKKGVTNDRLQRLLLLENTIGWEEEMLPPHIKLAQNQFAGDDYAHRQDETIGLRAIKLRERDQAKKEAAEYKQQYEAYRTRQRARDAAVLDFLNKFDNPKPPYHEVTDKNREKFYHRICRYAMTGDMFGDPLTKKGRDGKPSALYECLDRASKNYIAQVETDLETTKSKEQKLQLDNEKLSKELDDTKKRETDLQTSKDLLESQLSAAQTELIKANKAAADEKEVVKRQKGFMTEDQHKIADNEKKIAELEKENKTLRRQNSGQASENAALKTENTQLKSLVESFRTRFSSLLTSFLFFLHTEKEVKVTGKNFDADIADELAQEFNKRATVPVRKAGATPSLLTTFFGGSAATSTTPAAPAQAEGHVATATSAKGSHKRVGTDTRASGTHTQKGHS